MKKIYKKILLIVLLLINILFLIVVINQNKTPNIITLNNDYIDASLTSDDYKKNLNQNDLNNLIMEEFEGSKNENSPLNKIDKILFINLEHRKDRLKQINNEFKKMNFPKNKIKRIDAVNEKYNGHIGCCKSHIKAMNEIIKNDYKYTMVFEDDFVFTVDLDEFNKKINSFLNNKKDNWDIIQLASVHVKLKDTDNIKQNDFSRVKRASTSSAYIINRKFAPKLLEDLETSLSKMKKDMDKFNKMNNYIPKKKHQTNYALDQHWYPLQEKSKWYLFKPYLGKQGGNAGSSSIMNRNIEGFLSGYKVSKFTILC